MKNLILLASLLLSAQVFASERECTYTETKFNIFDRKQFVPVREKSMKQTSKFSNREKTLIMRLVDWTFLIDDNGDDVKRWYQLLEYIQGRTFNDVELTYFMHRKSRRVLLYVRSYPGENEYGLMFDKSGRVLAEVQDSDVYACK